MERYQRCYNGAITHYAMHLLNAEKTIFYAPVKTTKPDAIKIVGTAGNTVTTVVWNYVSGKWATGGVVSIVDASEGKYLKSAPDNKLSYNLGHLICWNHFIA